MGGHRRGARRHPTRPGPARGGPRLELIRSATEHDKHPGTARSILPVWYGLAARGAAALGDRDQAAEWARRAAFDADLLNLPGQRGHAALARAHSALDPVGPLREAVSGFRAGGLALEECRARLLLAAALASRDPHAQEQALEHANRAKSLAEASGARHHLSVPLTARLVLGDPAPHKAVDFVGVTLQLHLPTGVVETTAPQGWMEDALMDLQRRLPDGTRLLACISCAYSDYHPAGSGFIGSMACFRGCKDAYRAVAGKPDLFALWDKKSGFVQETFHCPDFEQRQSGTGYRGWLDCMLIAAINE